MCLTEISCIKETCRVWWEKSHVTGKQHLGFAIRIHSFFGVFEQQRVVDLQLRKQASRRFNLPTCRQFRYHL